MDIPKTVQEFLIWFGMQFPVLAASVLVGRWILRWSEENHAAEKADIEKRNQALLEEKEKRVAERDQRNGELPAEIEGLRAKHTRTRPKGSESNGGSHP